MNEEIVFKDEMLEMLNDAYWCRMLCNIKRKLNDNYQKNLLANIILISSISFCEETLKANMGEINEFYSFEKEKIRKDIKKARQKIMKDLSLSKNSSLKDSNLELELVFIDKELLDTSMSDCAVNKENFDFFNSITLTPQKWIDAFFTLYIDQLDEMINPILDKYAKKIQNYKFYIQDNSSLFLFNSANINEYERIYILKRYGIIKNAFVFNKIFNESLELKFLNYSLDFQKYIIKTNAIIIEMIWYDLKNNIDKISNIYYEFLKVNKENINDDFYSLNRSIRDNIHYEKTTNIECDFGKLLREQNMYFNNLLSVFDKCIDKKFFRWEEYNG